MSTVQPESLNKRKINPFNYLNLLKWVVLGLLLIAVAFVFLRSFIFSDDTAVALQPKLTEFVPLEGTKVRLTGTGTAGQELRILINQQREERALVDDNGVWVVETTAFGQTGLYDILVEDPTQETDGVPPREPIPVSVVVNGTSIESFDSPALSLLVESNTETVSTLIPTPNSVDDEIVSSVLLFRPNVSRATVGDTVQIVWEVETSEAMTLKLFNQTGDLIQSQAVDTQGGVAIEMQGDWGASVVAKLQDETGQINAETMIDLTCATVWAVQPQPSFCPATPVSQSRASQQSFENGQMVWVKALDTIYTLAVDGNTWITADQFEYEVDPIEDESIIAPEGLEQPMWGFGKVWREVGGLRTGLGWATAASTDYEASYQCGYNGICYMSTIEGVVLVADSANNQLKLEPTWSVQTEVSQ